MRKGRFLRESFKGQRCKKLFGFGESLGYLGSLGRPTAILTQTDGIGDLTITLRRLLMGVQIDNYYTTALTMQLIDFNNYSQIYSALLQGFLVEQNSKQLKVS